MIAADDKWASTPTDIRQALDAAVGHTVQVDLNAYGFTTGRLVELYPNGWKLEDFPGHLSFSIYRVRRIYHDEGQYVIFLA